jgi:hypothetical protein
LFENLAIVLRDTNFHKHCPKNNLHEEEAIEEGKVMAIDKNGLGS